MTKAEWVRGIIAAVGVLIALATWWRLRRKRHPKIRIRRVFLTKASEINAGLVEGLPGMQHIDNPVKDHELRAEVVNHPGCAEAYIRTVQVVAPGKQSITMEVERFEAERHRGQPAPSRPLRAGDQRIYCRSVRDLREFVRQKKVHVVARSNLGKKLHRRKVTLDLWDGCP